MGEPFGSGACDCALWICDWVLARRGVDPGAMFRGRYHSQAGARRLMAPYGGLEGLARTFFAQAGLQATTEPVRGDVGLVVDQAGHHALALCLGAGRWAGKARRGIVVEAFRVLAAWSV